MASWILSAMLCAVVGGSPDCTVVHFTASWCEPCKQIEPALQQLRQEGWTIDTVDVDRQPELVQQFRIENLPTLAILCRDQEVDRMVGAASYQRILERVERAAARNQSGPPRGQLASNQVEYDPPRGGPHHHGVGEACNHTGGTALGHTAQPVAPQPIVRGQSPELSGFPLLASNSSSGSRAPRAFEQQAAVLQTNTAQTNTAQTKPADSPTAERRATLESQPLSVEQAIARAAAATVRIRVDEANTTAYGTGTIVDVRGQEALILTCGHLFRDMQPNSQLTIDLFPGTAQEVNLPSELIDFKAEGEDIGLISFRIPLPIEPVPILGRGQNIGVGQPAFSFGCDHGANPTRRDTQIKSVNRYLGADNIEIVGAPSMGRSGGGLFDMQGRLIGVCNAANAEDNEGIYASAEVVYTQIERLGLSELFGEGAPIAAAAAAVQLASAPVASPSQGSTSGNLQWPDQSASLPQLSESNLSAAGGQNPGAQRALVNQSPVAVETFGGAEEEPLMAARSTRQVICIVRDSGGQDKVITIDAPPEQLLQMIQQQSQRQNR